MKGDVHEPLPAPSRVRSNQSTIDTNPSRNSHLDMSDPSIRRMFGLEPDSSSERLRRMELILDQCETVRFPFKKRLVLANMNLAQDEIPVDQICSDRLGAALHKLSLAGNRLNAIPREFVANLKALRVLDVSQCDLTSVPDDWNLPCLKKLNLSHNKIETFLSETVLRGLPQLERLDMYSNRLVEISASSLDMIARVEHIDVGYNHLTEIPGAITRLKFLKTFNCTNNLIEIVPAEVCEMESMRVLDVSSNPLIQPPLETCERGLHSMRRYYHCLRLEESADVEASAAASQKGGSSFSIVKKIRNDKCRAKMRKRKESSKKPFPSSLMTTGIFRATSEPAQPTQQYSSMESSAEHSQSTKSRSLAQDLTPPMRSVSFSLSKRDTGSAKPARNISDSTNDTRESSHFDATPESPCEQNSFSDSDNDAELADSRLGGGGGNVPDQITVNETLKVIFVGMALSGKTSIIKRLIEGQDAKIPQSDERTVGVDIYEWDPKQAGGAASDSLMTRIPVDSELESRIKGSTGVKFSVWDFAGQHVYHATHELFFSTNSLYVLVWDMGANNPETIKKQKTFTEGEQGTFKLTYDSSDEEDDDFFDTEHENRRATRALEQDIDEKLQFWIDCIQSSAPGAAILPVASFDDYFTEGVGVEEARFRCRLMRERLLKHEQHRVKNMEQRLKEYDAKFGASSELAVRLRKLLCSFNRPKIIFGTDGPDVVRVSSTNFTGFDDLAERIVGISTGRERAGWNYPIFRGHLGARIPRMRLAVRDCVRSMRDRFKVVEWGFFLDELKKKDIDNAADVADALHFLANIGELSYFGDVSPPKESRSPASNVGLVEGFDEDESQTPLNSSESVSLSTHTTRTLTGASFARNDRDENTRDSAPTQKRASHGLSEFVFLNPRWLVAAVACILRHDLTTEIYEVRRALRNAGNLGGGESLSLDAETYLDSELTTDVNYPVITAKDACMLWQAKRFTKKAAERALQHSNNSNVSPYEFLQRLLVRFGVFVPVDLSIKTCLGGKDYSHHYEYADCLEFGPSYSSGLEQAPKFFFLPSLLGPGDANISEIWTYKTAESWKTTICHSILFPDGVPPGLMERITATILSDLYTNPANDNPGPLDPQEQRQDGRLRIKEILCWRSAFYLKLGNLEPDGGVSESIVEIFVTLVDQGSPQCVASDSTGVGMRRLVFSGKGQAGDNGAKIWRGGYLRILRIAVKHIEAEYSGLEIEKQAICPTCLAKKPIGQASLWDHSTIRSVRARGEQTIRCRSGHVNDVRLITGTYDQPDVDVLTTTAPLSDAGDIPVSNLLKAVVIVGVWDEKAQRIIRAGSGFIVDRKRGFVVTAAHTLMDRENWSEVKGKIVIGVIPKDRSSNDPVAVYRYFARILAKDPSINDAGVCTLDACILQIQTKMECDVHESDKTIGDQPETLLMNNPVAMKNENFDQLKLSEKHELDEAVRILGFNQGGEGLIGPGQEMNRCADFARGYVVMKFNVQENSVISNFQPRSEIVVICPTIGGHSGGPCVNQQGEVIGILSRADPADRQRCYLVPASEFAPLVKVAKKMLKLSSSRS